MPNTITAQPSPAAIAMQVLERLHNERATPATSATASSHDQQTSEFVAGCREVHDQIAKHVAMLGTRPSSVRGASELHTALRRADLALASAQAGNLSLAARRLRQIDTTMACLGLAYRTPQHLKAAAAHSPAIATA